VLRRRDIATLLPTVFLIDDIINAHMESLRQREEDTHGLDAEDGSVFHATRFHWESIGTMTGNEQVFAAAVRLFVWSPFLFHQPTFVVLHFQFFEQESAAASMSRAKRKGTQGKRRGIGKRSCCSKAKTLSSQSTRIGCLLLPT